MALALWSVSGYTFAIEQNRKVESCGPDFNHVGFPFASSLTDDEVPFRNNIDLSCFVSADQVADQIDQYQVIDVRENVSKKPGLPGALQISYRSLIHKSYLSSKKLLLIDKSFGNVRPSHWCDRLKQSGFKSVQYLVGGEKGYRSEFELASFNAQAGPASSALGGDLSEVSAADFWTEWHNGQVRVVSFGDGVQQKLKQLELTVALDLTKNKSEQMDALSSFLIADQENALVPVVVIGDDAQKARRLVNKVQQLNLFYLADNARGLKSFLQKHRAIVGSRNKKSSQRMMCNA
ncbi:hypothetical protein BGP75_08325 [Motiliproteus sp. MSK22-1]|nr:hypothetical protein BGP75_08325 [Motiliproteus sp. MSK22-1]